MMKTFGVPFLSDNDPDVLVGGTYIPRNIKTKPRYSPDIFSRRTQKYILVLV